MILRRLTEHVKAQNWFAIAIDFVIVVVGVFIGIQVANWNAARIDRQEEAGYLAAMEEDVAFSIKGLEELVISMGRQEEARAALYSYSLDPNATLAQEDRDRYLSRGLFHIATLNISEVTFEALKGSGNLGALGSPALISALQSASASVAEIVRREHDETEVAYLFSDPLLVSGVDMTGVFLQPSINGAPPAIGWLAKGVSAPPVEPDVMKSLAFRNAVLYRSYFNSARLRDVKGALEQYRRIAGLIDARQAALGVAP